MSLIPPAQERLAGVVPRGLAYLIDCTFVFAFYAITQLWVLTPLRDVIGLEYSWFASGLNTQLYTLVTISLPIWLYFAVFEQSAWQATPGKRLLKLRVIGTIEPASISFPTAFLRTLIKLLPWELAHITNNLPEPIWFAENPEFRFGFIGVGLLMGIYMAMVTFTKQHQGLHDLVAQTYVIKSA